MLERKAMHELIEWKNNPNKMCLLVKGARQVGKTYLIDKFCQENYNNYVYINFFEMKECHKIFSGNLDIENIIKQLTAFFPNKKIIPNETVIFLDEIQECPEAFTALKFLTISKQFDVIASGSLLGINYKEIPSYPVGYIDHLEMNSLDFEEFCWAIGINKNVFKDLKENFDKKEQVLPYIHTIMLKAFREYIIVGGMPEVVEKFVNTNNFSEVLKVQRKIIEDYKMDIGKYARETEKAKVRDCFLSIPKHLAKDYKKFRYSLVSSGGKREKYQGSLRWLQDAEIINVCYNLTNPEFPLEGNRRDDSFKVYMKDTGLLMGMLEEGTAREILNGNLGIYKGAIYENIIADIFAKNNKKLYYFEHNSTLEIDFFIRFQDKITAVEVKSADNTKSKSLKSVMENYNVGQGIKLSSKNLGFKDNVISYPIYMAIFL